MRQILPWPTFGLTRRRILAGGLVGLGAGAAGFDSSSQALQAALARGALDRACDTLSDAVAGADAVFVAVPAIRRRAPAGGRRERRRRARAGRSVRRRDLVSDADVEHVGFAL